MKIKCLHSKVKLVGEQVGDKGKNIYYKCVKCGSVLILSDEGKLYEISGE